MLITVQCTCITFYIIKVRLYFDISVKIVRVQINKCVERNSLLDDIFGMYCAGRSRNGRFQRTISRDM